MAKYEPAITCLSVRCPSCGKVLWMEEGQTVEIKKDILSKCICECGWKGPLKLAWDIDWDRIGPNTICKFGYYSAEGVRK